MLTPPKWQTVWLKSQYSSKKISKKIMFPKPADKILDDLSKCCGSSSKELTLEALNCWRIWIDNQHADNWKQNETCYSAVRPLLTKKFHPLHKDTEVSEIKLSLMWLSLQKVQHLMHLEGPQHVLEVFIESCISWLCSEEVDSSIQDLILKLLRFLFSKDVKVLLRNESFSPLEGDVFKSRKFFCRLLNYFLDIFRNWTRVKQKADLLYIWTHFLDQCELSFKLIPVAVWHRIFKLVENICGDENEQFLNKIALLHKCAISLKSVMSNSKFIDCSQALTTPAEALLKMVVELSVNNGDGDVSLESFNYCQEISEILSNHIVDAFGFESCISVLSTIDEIESKSVFWGLWCGMTKCFKERVKSLSVEQYNKAELKLYRKLRAVAANFDLDRPFLEEKPALTVEDHLSVLRVPNYCQICSTCSRKLEDNEVLLESSSPSKVNEPSSDFSGIFGFEINPMTCNRLSSTENNRAGLVVESGNFTDIPEIMELDIVHTNGESFNRSQLTSKKSMSSADTRSVRRNLSSKTLKSTYSLFVCDLIRSELLITLNYQCRSASLFAPVYLIVKLEEMCKNTRTINGLLSRSCIENMKKVLNEIREAKVAMEFPVSFNGQKGVDFYGNTVKFWGHVDDIICNVDINKLRKILIRSSSNSVLWFYAFLFLVKFMKNLFVESADRSTCECRKFDLEEEKTLFIRIDSFMKNVVYHKERLSTSVFIDNVQHIIPRHTDNPIVLWNKFISLRNTRLNESEIQCIRHCSSEETSHKQDSVINVFKRFDSLRDKASDMKSENKIKGKERSIILKKEKSECKALNINFEVECHKENKNVEVVHNPPDIFGTVAFSEWNIGRLSSDVRECSPPEDANVLKSIDTTPKRRRNIKVNRVSMSEKEIENGMRTPPRKRKRESGTNMEKLCEKGTDENLQSTPKRNKNSDVFNDYPCTCGRLKENLSPSSIKNYSLRQRPLQRPSKFKDTKCLFAVGFAKKRSMLKNEDDNSLSPCRKCLANEFTEDNHHNYVKMKTEDHKEPVDVNCTIKTDVKFDKETDQNDCSFKVTVEVVVNNIETENLEDIDMIVSNLENDKSIIDSLEEKTDDVDSLSTAPVEHEINSDQISHFTDPIKRCKDESSDEETNNRGVKRRAQDSDEPTSPKKLRMGGENECNEEQTINEKPDSLSENTIKKEITEKEKNQSHRVEIPMIESRGSRILGLIPESPKLKRFQDSPPSSKQQVIRRPNILRNSRASKMLALLPDLNKEVESAEDKARVTKDESCGKGISVGKTHHLIPNRNGSVLLSESPKRSPIRQRKSIRFDEDRNETVTYYTDSPPCQVVREGTRFRGIDKGKEDIICTQ